MIDPHHDRLGCDCEVIHADTVEHVKAKLPDELRLYDLAELFKVFGDTTRVKLLWALDVHEMCVCDLAALFNMTKSAVSHQLKVLRQAKLVRSRRDGKNVFYSFDDEHVRGIFEMGMAHVQEGWEVRE